MKKEKRLRKELKRVRPLLRVGRCPFCGEEEFQQIGGTFGLPVNVSLWGCLACGRVWSNRSKPPASNTGVQNTEESEWN